MMVANASIFRCSSCPRHWSVIANGKPSPAQCKCPECGKAGKAIDLPPGGVGLAEQPRRTEAQPPPRAGLRR